MEENEAEFHHEGAGFGGDGFDEEAEFPNGEFDEERYFNDGEFELKDHGGLRHKSPAPNTPHPSTPPTTQQHQHTEL